MRKECLHQQEDEEHWGTYWWVFIIKFCYDGQTKDINMYRAFSIQEV